MTCVGSMQGRLLPPYGNRIQCFPKDNWRLEFGLAAQAGLQCIEWILDGHGIENNPIGSVEGLEAIREASSQQGVKVKSVCADLFMEQPLLRATQAELEERIRSLVGLLGRCGMLGVSRVVVPFVDASRIDSQAEMAEVIAVMREVLGSAKEFQVEVHLETSLGPLEFANLMERIDHPMCRVNYDSGNSASLGYSPLEEFQAYGPWVGSVHIKDRVLGGGTVPLGQGSTDFEALWKCLKKVMYAGDFILQVARGEAGDEVAWARKNLAFVAENLRKFEIGSHAAES